MESSMQVAIIPEVFGNNIGAGHGQTESMNHPEQRAQAAIAMMARVNQLLSNHPNASITWQQSSAGSFTFLTAIVSWSDNGIT